MTAYLFVPENRLKHVIEGPGGLTAETLESKALALVSKLEPDLKAHIAEQVEVVEDIGAEKEEILFARSLTLGDAGLSICEVAGAVGLEPLGEAAKGIVAMIDALTCQGVWHTEALRLHIDALTMFAANPALPEAEVRQVLARLKVLRDEIGVEE